MESRKNVLLFMVLLITISSTLTSTTADLIEDVCKELPQFNDLCLSTLRSDPRSARSDITGLARIIAEHALAKAKETTVVINQLLRTTREFKPELSACARMYKAAVGQHLPTAIKSIQEKNASQALNFLTAASDDALDCDDGFEGGPGVPPIKERNDVVSQLCVISVGIISRSN